MSSDASLQVIKFLKSAQHTPSLQTFRSDHHDRPLSPQGRKANTMGLKGAIVCHRLTRERDEARSQLENAVAVAHADLANGKRTAEAEGEEEQPAKRVRCIPKVAQHALTPNTVARKLKRAPREKRHIERVPAGFPHHWRKPHFFCCYRFSELDINIYESRGQFFACQKLIYSNIPASSQTIVFRAY